MDDDNNIHIMIADSKVLLDSTTHTNTVAFYTKTSFVFFFHSHFYIFNY